MSIRKTKELFVQKGQIKDNIIDREIAISWRKSKLFGLLPEDRPNFDNAEYEQEETDLSRYCERLVPEFISFFITVSDGKVVYKRAVSDSLKDIADFSERIVGTTSFSVSMNSKKDAIVRKEEHYLDWFTEFTSRTILIPGEHYQITLFYSGLENEYLYMSLKNSVLSYVNEKGVMSTSEKPDVVLSNYIPLDDYDIDRLDDYLIQTEGRFPLLIYGRDAEFLAWYIADRMLTPTLRISHTGIPENLMEDKLIEYSKKSNTLIISELDNAPEKYLTLVSQIVDFMLEASGKRKKQIILTAKVRPAYERIISKLALSAIDLDSCMTVSPENFPFKTIEQVERELIEQTLRATEWNPTLAAKMLGIGRATLYRKMKLYRFDNKRSISK